MGSPAPKILISCAATRGAREPERTKSQKRHQDLLHCFGAGSQGSFRAREVSRVSPQRHGDNVGSGRAASISGAQVKRRHVLMGKKKPLCVKTALKRYPTLTMRCLPEASLHCGSFFFLSEGAEPTACSSWKTRRCLPSLFHHFYHQLYAITVPSFFDHFFRSHCSSTVFDHFVHHFRSLEKPYFLGPLVYINCCRSLLKITFIRPFPMTCYEHFSDHFIRRSRTPIRSAFHNYKCFFLIRCVGFPVGSYPLKRGVLFSETPVSPDRRSDKLARM